MNAGLKYAFQVQQIYDVSGPRSELHKIAKPLSKACVGQGLSKFPNTTGLQVSWQSSELKSLRRSRGLLLLP